MKDKDIISIASINLYHKLKELNIDSLNISAQTSDSLKRYLADYSFYMSLYKQLILKSLKTLKKPVSESTFIDYGGGSGMLSWLAKEIGFRSVVYNDIFPGSVNDAEIVSGGLNLEIDHYICGDVQELVSQIRLYKIVPDIICSFDVLEHIYDIKTWIKTISELSPGFSIVFMTSANSYNPLIRSRLKKLHIVSELKGCEKNVRIGNAFLSTSFLEERQKIISARFPRLNSIDVNLLSSGTRGLREDDIEKVVEEYIRSGVINYHIDHPTNTCDPYTGSWTEKLIDLNELKIFMSRNNLIFDISNNYYTYSKNLKLNLPKYLLNHLIKLSGTKCLFFSPSFTLVIKKV